jgi:hypothetical protein
MELENRGYPQYDIECALNLDIDRLSESLYILQYRKNKIDVDEAKKELLGGLYNFGYELYKIFSDSKKRVHKKEKKRQKIIWRRTQFKKVIETLSPFSRNIDKVLERRLNCI